MVSGENDFCLLSVIDFVSICRQVEFFDYFESRFEPINASSVLDWRVSYRIYLKDFILNCFPLRLTSLSELILNNNKLTELPTSIGLLRNLRTLNLDENQLIDLPPDVSKKSFIEKKINFRIKREISN